MNNDNSAKVGFRPNRIEKSGYHLEFQDNFRGTVLDTGKWLPYYLPHWSSRELAAARYSLGETGLQLLIEEDQGPWCPAYDGEVRVSSLQTGCFSGPVGSSRGQHRFKPGLAVAEEQPDLRLYTPQYGFFETRLKASPIPGYMVALWMIGFEENPEQSAEICICEIFGNHLTEQSATVGYGIHPFHDPALRDEFYQEQVDFNAAEFHVYATEWTPCQVAFFIDNVHVRTIRQSPNYPMQFMLGFYEIPDQLVVHSEQAPWPKAAVIDYVRGYQPTAGYGIEKR